MKPAREMESAMAAGRAMSPCPGPSGGGRGERGRAFASGAPGAALLAGPLALAAALSLAPDAARATDDCGALNSGNSFTETCPNQAYATGIVYWDQTNPVTLTVTGGPATTLTAAANGGVHNGITIRTSAHASEARNISLTVGSGGAVAIEQSGTRANSWYNNRGIVVFQRTANGSTTTVDVRSGVTIGTSTTKMESRGIEVTVDSAATGAGAVSVTSAAAIYSEDTGIRVENPGAGAVTVRNSGAIVTDGRGIYVDESGSAGAVTVRNSGAITSASTANQEGIFARTTDKDSAGANAGVSITHSAGAIAVAAGGVGIKAHVGEARGDEASGEAHASYGAYVAPRNAGLAKVEVTGGSIRSKGETIEAVNYEAGSVEVTVSEGVTLTSTHGYGIWAALPDVGNTSGTISVTNAATIMAGTENTGRGISIHRAAGSGAVTVTNRGAVTASGHGIHVSAGGAGGTVSVTNTATIAAGTTADTAHGISVERTAGSGAVMVTNRGAVTVNGDGIRVFAGGAGGTVTVTNHGALGAAEAKVSYGIFVSHAGTDATGAVTVTNGGAITAQAGGILARTTGKDAEGANAGVTVTHSAGAVTTENLDGIRAYVGEPRGDEASGGAHTTYGAYVAPRNAGLARVEVTGGSVRSKLEAVEAINYEAGSVEVTVSEGVTLTSTHGYGIWAALTDVGNTSGTLSVTNAATIRAGTAGELGHGIGVGRAGGSGAVTITNRGAVTASHYGIRAFAGGAGGTVTVTNHGALGTADAMVNRGIFVLHYGTGAAGAVTVTNHGAIASTGDGIYARTTVEDTAGANVGVTVTHSAGAITSADGRGVKVHVGQPRQEADTSHDDYAAPRNRGLAKVEVTGGSISSKWEPVEAYNYEGGSIEVRVASGVTLSSTQGHGIWGALTDPGNADGAVTIDNAGTIRVPKHGITFAIEAGSGDLSVTNRGALEVGGDGIFAVARPGVTGDVTVTNTGAIGTADARAGRGIFASHDGTGATGAVTVANSGDIMATDRGILAQTKSLDADGAEDGVTVTHSAGTIDVTEDAPVDSDKTGIVARVGRWRQETDSAHADYVAPKNTGLVRIDVTGGSIVAKGSAVEGANYEGGGVRIDVAKGVTLSSAHEHAVEADLRDVGNAGGTIAITQAGALSASADGISAKVARRSAVAAPDRPVIDIVWTGTFTALEDQRGSLPNVARAVAAAAMRQASEKAEIRFAQGSAGIDAGVMKWQTFMRPVSEGDDPGAFADKAAQDALFAEDADAATMARAAAIVAQLRSVLTDESLGTIPGADAIDADNDDDYSDEEIMAYLSEDDDARRTLLRNILAQSFTDDEMDVDEMDVFRAVIEGGDVEAALAAAPDSYGDAWKAGVRALLAHHNDGNIRIAMNGGSIASGGDGIRAFFGRSHADNGRIDVTVAEGASVTGGMAGVYVANAGAGLRIEKKYTEPAIQAINEDLGPDDLVTLPDYLDQVVRVHGAVTGGTDAAVHLAGGGALIVRGTGRLVAGSSGRAILVNDPGPAVIYIEGEVRGGSGSGADAQAAVDMTGGGSVTVGLNGRVEANGADAAIRGDNEPTAIYIEGEVKGGEGAQAAVDMTGGSVTVGLNGRVQANGADAAIRGDNEPTAIYIEGEVKGGEGAQAAVHLTGGGSVTVGLNGRVQANGADAAIRGDNKPTAVIIQTGETLDELTQESAGRVLARVEGGIVGDGVGDGITLAEVKNGMATGHRVRPLNPDGTVKLDDLPRAEFECARAEDGRCRLYEALPSMLLGMNDLPTYAERTAAARDANGGWARVETTRGEWKADKATTTGKLAYDHRRSGGRAGVDFPVGENARIGASMHVLKGNAEMSGVGEAELDSMGAGLSATWQVGDFYVDAQAATTWYDARIDSATESGRLVSEVDGRGHALGLDVGSRMVVGEGLAVTPRVGLAWSKVDLDDFVDSVGSGARVSLKDAKSTKGRVGMVVETWWVRDTPGRVFGSVDVEHEFSDETSVNVAGDLLETTVRPTGVRLGLGGEFSLGEGVSLRAVANYTTSGGDTNEYGGGVELNMRF